MVQIFSFRSFTGLSLAVLLAWPVMALGQSPGKKAPAKEAAKTPPPAKAPKDAVPAKDDKEAEKVEKSAPATGARADFEKLMEEWKTILKDLRQLRSEFQTAGEADQKKQKDQFTALIAKGNEMLPRLRTAALAAYQESGGADPQLERFLLKFVADAVETDDFENGMSLSKLLIDAGCSDKVLQGVAGICAYCTNDYAAAETHFKIASDAGFFSAGTTETEKLGMQLMPLVSTEKGLWEKELAIRKEEAAKDDLPRVQLTTSKGVIVLELFENEAPDTVGNFISLVEKKFYDGVKFHRVLQHFMAQGGDPQGDGRGGPGYQIYCECYKPEYRRHFRGSLSMAHAGRDTGGSQFFLTFRPTPELDGRHTCFGRVVEGMDVLAKLQRRDPEMDTAGITPDKIIEAKVVRKREHAYAPKKVEQ